MNVENRLARLERQNKRQKQMMAVMAVAGLSLLIMGQTRPVRIQAVIKARAIAVVDAQGRTKILLSATKGAGEMVVGGRNGVIAVRISEDSNGVGIVRTYKNKKISVSIGSSKDGSMGTINTYMPGKKRLVWLGGNTFGQGVIEMYGKQDKKTISMSGNRGGGIITTYTQDGKPSFAAATSQKTGGTRVVLRAGRIIRLNQAGTKIVNKWPGK